jgi:hypothetical protein
MAREDLILAPESLEALLGGLGDLQHALGPGAAAGLASVRKRLQEAVTARQDGDRDRAVAAITAAMRELAELATALDPQEAAMMRAIATQFETALRQGDPGSAVESVDRMRERSGAVKKRGDENKL